MSSATLSRSASREDIERFLRRLFDEHGHTIAHDGWLAFVGEDSFSADLPDLLLDIDDGCGWIVPESEMPKFNDFDTFAKWVDYFFANREKFGSAVTEEVPSTSSRSTSSGGPGGTGEQSAGCC